MWNIAWKTGIFTKISFQNTFFIGNWYLSKFNIIQLNYKIFTTVRLKGWALCLSMLSTNHSSTVINCKSGFKSFQGRSISANNVKKTLNQYNKLILGGSPAVNGKRIPKLLEHYSWTQTQKLTHNVWDIGRHALVRYSVQYTICTIHNMYKILP